MEWFFETTNGVNNGRTVMIYAHLVGDAPESMTMVAWLFTALAHGGNNHGNYIHTNMQGFGR